VPHEIGASSVSSAVPEVPFGASMLIILMLR
jgi:hypothetical protein